MNGVTFKGFSIGKAINDIIKDKTLNGDEKTILITISLYHEDLIEGNPAMSLSIETVSEIVNCSKSTAIRIMKKLIEKGCLDSIKKGQGNPNIYVFKGWRKWQ